MVLDGIEDPHNLGAILRTADAAGVDGVVDPEPAIRGARRRGGQGIGGAVAHVKIAEVVNIARAVEELKEFGVWTVGLAGEAAGILRRDRFHAAERDRAGGGGSRVCGVWCGNGATFLASIPMRGHVGSLNVSVAAGIVLFEAVRQRRAVQERVLRAAPGK